MLTGRVVVQRRAKGVEWSTRYEASVRVAEHGHVIAYGFTRRSARRHLKRMLRK